MDLEQREDALSTAVKAVGTCVKTGNDQINQRVTDLTSSIEANYRQVRGDLERHLEVLENHGRDLADLSSRVRVTEVTLVAMVGVGDGQSGSLNELRRGLNNMQAQLSSVSSTVTLIEERTRGVADTESKSKSFIDGWHGVATALSVTGILFTIVSAITGIVLVAMKVTGKF